MATQSLKQAPLVVIVGPTASGKTGLSVRLAKQCNGEIISADSRAIYKGMDIVTAKPSVEERDGVAHWGIDLVEPGEAFSVADFQQYACKKVDEMRSRGRVPVLVGGAGLYTADPLRRHSLMEKDIRYLHEYCIKNNITLPENKFNKRYVVRAIEQKGINTIRRGEPIDNCIVVGISTERNVLRTRIENRSEQLFINGVVEEAKMLGEKYGWNSEAMTGNIYPLVRKYMDGVINESELKQKFITADWRLAKRQLTWLRRNPFIVWRSLDEAEFYLSQKLADWINS